MRQLARNMAILLMVALPPVVAAASPPAANGTTRPFDRTGFALARPTSSHRFTSDRGRVRRRAGEFDLRASLTDTFTSIELGAPPSVPVGGNPSGIAVDQDTHTVYVVNQADDTVSVIDGRACNARRPWGCGGALATIALGPGDLQNGPIAAVLSPDGNTLYVTSPGGANTVAVIDAATCNATNTSGCADGPVASVATGQGPVGMAEDPVTQTLYVANIAGNTVSVINGRRCNAEQTAGCAEMAPTVPVGTAPVAVGLDPDAQTAYVANIDDDNVSVIDTRRCNAEQPSGCGQTPPVQAVGGAPAAIAVSPGGDTVYVANSGIDFDGNTVLGGNTVSVVDARACSGRHPDGCSAVPAPVVAVGAGQDNQPQSIAIDAQTQNVYVANSNDDTLSILDGPRCSARGLHACPQPAPTLQTGALPNAVAVLPSVHTIYVVDSADNAVGVVSDRTCTDADPTGCRPAPVPAARLAPDHQLSVAAVDPAYHTAYVVDSGLNGAGPYALDLIDTRRCNAGNSAGCDPHPPLATVALANSPSGVAVDTRTGTLYVPEGDPGPGPDQLEVIAAASCNATITSCAKRATIPFAGSAIPNGNIPQNLVLDSSTHTVYLGFPGDIAVIDVRHCNAHVMTGCATQTPATIPFPFGGMAIAPDTLYVTGFESFDAPGWVHVFDTRHCQAADTSQCATQNPTKVPVGVFPDDAAVDLAHHTLFVVDFAGGDAPGQLSMIDTTRCNGDDISGCAGQIPPTIPMRRAPVHAAFDPVTSTLYVTNFENASVSEINTATCHATTAAACPHVTPQAVVGSGPLSPALDPDTETLYVPSFWDGTVSMVPTGHY